MIKPQFFLLDSSAEADYRNEDHLFALSDVERAVECPEGKEVIISVSGRGKMELSKLQCMRRFTHWDSLFPIEYDKVLHTLQDVVDMHKAYCLWQHLGAPSKILATLRVDSPDIDQLVRWWMSSSLEPPYWWKLAEALKDSEMAIVAEEIQKDHRKFKQSFFVCSCTVFMYSLLANTVCIGLHIQLQELLLVDNVCSCLSMNIHYLLAMHAGNGHMPTLYTLCATKCPDILLLSGE